MAVTMRDVAQLAGVSQRTVSNVVNDYVHVRPETRERVKEAIASLRYSPNASAQGLRLGRTGLLALSLPEVASPYFAETAEELQRYAKECGVTLLMDHTGGDRDRELIVLEGYRSSLIDGLILHPLAVTTQDLVLSQLDIPVVLLGERIDDSGFLHVSIDNVAAARVATEHLLAGGRQRIAVVGAPSSTVGGVPGVPGAAVRRFEGFVAACAEVGLEPVERLVARTDAWTRPEGYAVAERLLALADPPDAVFCFNDALAVGVLKALGDRGVRVPEEVAVVGWDDVAEARFTTPSLTSLAPDKAAIARAAVDGLLAQIEGRPVEVAEHHAPFTLAVRLSS